MRASEKCHLGFGCGIEPRSSRTEAVCATDAPLHIHCRSIGDKGRSLFKLCNIFLGAIFVNLCCLFINPAVLKLGVATLFRVPKYWLRVAKVHDCPITLNSPQGSTSKPS